MSQYAHIRKVVDASRASLQDWVASLMVGAGEDLPVTGVVPTDPMPPRLVLLPYQIVLESQASTPSRTLVPCRPDQVSGSISPAWQSLAQAMTQYLLDHFPQRPSKGPGLGPLDPMPRLDQLRPEMAAWYREHASEWVVAGDRGRLPSVQWRQPFSFVVRYAAFVVDTNRQERDLDRLRMVALAVISAGIRQKRHFEARVPPEPVPDDLKALIRAMVASAAPELADDLAKQVEGVRRAVPIAVGVYPHHELTDMDLALVMQALQLPMQPAVVFALRLSLGAGPYLEKGASPHLESVDLGER